MKRRMFSRPDTDLLFMSGLREEDREDGEEAGPAQGPSKREDEVRELRSPEDEDDGPTQEEILAMIKTEMKSEMGDNSIENDDDDDIIILTPTTLFTSNRTGGREFLSIKEEPEEHEVFMPHNRP